MRDKSLNTNSNMEGESQWSFAPGLRRISAAAVLQCFFVTEIKYSEGYTEYACIIALLAADTSQL